MEQPHQPRTGDDVEAWLKRVRDRHREALSLDGLSANERAAYDWMARGVDDLLDRYRECAHYGLTLRAEDDDKGDP